MSLPATSVVLLTTGVDLADASAVDAFYAAIPDLWASIHLAGGFAMSPIGETSADDFTRMMEMQCADRLPLLQGRVGLDAGIRHGRPHRQCHGAAGS